MVKQVSMADIARHLNISRATVSYVLNGRESELISEGTRARVLEAARSMGYSPNRAAQSLAGRPSHLIELFVHGYYPAYYARALYEFERQVGPTPYQLYIVHRPQLTTDEWEKTRSGWPTDGIILFDELLSEQMIASLEESAKPFVAVGMLPSTDIDHVYIDVSPALTEAMQHLTARGGRIAFLSPWNLNTGWTEESRYVAYRAAMKAANLPEEIIVTPDGNGPGTRTIAAEIIRDYLKKNGCPNAIFCFNDERAIATLDVLLDLGYRVPQDVLLIGHDGIEETAYHRPRLSTIDYPIEEGARLAWQFLQHRLENPKTPLQSATLTANLVLRESSAY